MTPSPPKTTPARGGTLLGTLGLFIGGGWVVLQVIDLFIERGFLPEWTFDGALLALTFGLPVVMATAWFQRKAGRKAGTGNTDVAGGSDASTKSVQPTGMAAIFTWKRAIAGGVLSFALLGLLTAGFMVMRATGIGPPATLAAQGTFEVGGSVVLADFESSVSDEAPADLITEALRIDLEGSATLDVISEAEVVETQRLMVLDPSEPLSYEVAREVAVRIGAPGVLSGEVGRVGTSYVITSRLVEAESGTVLASFRTAAEDAEALVLAIDELAAEMRTKVGESMRSVAASTSLASVTTESLEALKKYTYVRNRIFRGSIEPAVARQLLEEAVALDSTFATAYLSLAIAINNYGGSQERAFEASSAAYRHRERLSERERLAVEAYYYNTIGDRRRASQTYRRIMEVDPENTAAPNNLADITMYAGDYEGALALLEGTPNPGNHVWAWNRHAILTALGRTDEAIATLDSASALNPIPWLQWGKAQVLLMSGDVIGAEAMLESLPPVPPGVEVGAALIEANVDLAGGRIEAAEEKMTGAAAFSRRAGIVEEEIFLGLHRGLVMVWIARDHSDLAPFLDELFGDLDLTDVSARDLLLPIQALLHAMVGDEQRVAEVVRRYRVSVDVDLDPEGRAIAGIAETLVELSPGAPDAWVELEASLSDLECHRCALVLEGFAAERSGRLADAASAYEEYLAKPFFDGSNAFMRIMAGNVHERLGPLYEEIGDPAAAARHYARFAELWRNADARLQPRVDFARERAEALGSS